MSRARLVLVGLLIWGVIASGLAVAYAKFSSRKLFVELQAVQEKRDQIDVEWGKLQLESGTWGAHGLVEKTAHEKLSMRPPTTQEIMVLRLGQQGGAPQ